MPSEDSHLSDELLLMELDGELSPRAAGSARAHLDACWQCRARRQELERSIADVVQAYRQEFGRPLPPAAGPRALLKAELAQCTAEAKQPGRWLMAWPRPISAAALAVVCLLIAGWILAGDRWPKRDQVPRAGTSYALSDLAISTPDAALTPGAAILLSRSTVCSQANVKNKDVPPSIRRAVFKEYGLAAAQRRSYEVDYLVTPALGGSDDIRNLWPHSYSSLWNARVKDALEDRLREMVCDGVLELADAQREIAGNWIEAYKKYFHTDRPLPEHTKLMNIRHSLWLACLTVFATGCSKAPNPADQKAEKTPPVSYFKVDLATAGTISGSIQYLGRKPSPKSIDMSGDPACEQAHHGKVYDESLLVAPKGGLANAFVYIKSGLEGKSFETPAAPVTLDQHGCWFTPRVIGMQTNQPLEISNSDPITHNVHPMPESNREWNHSQGSGDPPITRRFPRPEVMIPVKCNIHSWMHCFIGVLDHPYFAVSEADGTFAIKNVPPGDYVLEAWHEKLGRQEYKVTVPPSGQQKVDFQFKGE